MPGTDRIAAAVGEDPWDAIVVGAGPAGAIAARQLALQSKRVLLVDKAILPRDKVCGGCLGGVALEVLASIGLEGVPYDCGGVPLRTLTLASAGVIARIPIGHRVAVSRRTFDGALVREAARAGVVICDQTIGTMLRSVNAGARLITLRHQAREVIVRSKVIIVATGLARSPPAYTTRILPGCRIGIGAMLDQPPCYIAPGALHMAWGSDGYVGVTAVEDGRFDVAAAVDPHALAATKSPGKLVHGILAESGFAPIIDLQTAVWHGTPPLTRRTTPLASQRCLLIGDAAGYVEPFTGEGLGWAMQSAVLATSLLTGSLDRWDEAIPACWQWLYNSALAGRQRSCRIVSRLLGVKPLRQVAIWGLRRAPHMSGPIVRRLDRSIGAEFCKWRR
jgi:flavin-dependent dehydrogenase